MSSFPEEHILPSAIENRNRRHSGKIPIHPRRVLSQFLIALLLLLSPITFSTDKITNFVYECPVSATCHLKARRSVVNQRTDVVQAQWTVVIPLSNGLPETIIPPAVPVCFASPCRAPPA